MAETQLGSKDMSHKALMITNCSQAHFFKLVPRESYLRKGGCNYSSRESLPNIIDLLTQVFEKVLVIG
jgi:hypothetical protein